MPSTFFGLNTAASALAAAQLQLDIAAHNTANASTDGYSRQRVTLVASEPYTYPAFNRSGLPGQIGTGVSVATISRVRDAFLDSQLRTQTALQGAATSRSDFLSQLESVFPEPAGSGLGSVISDFWNAWQDVAADPTSTAARAALVEQVGTLASRFNRDATQLSSVIDSVDNLVSQDVGTVNQLATQIAGLNAQIQRVSISGDHPNDLQDQRDLLLDQLAKLTSFSLEPQSDGTVRVLLGGTDLVSGDQARAISTGTDANGHLVPTWSWGSNVTLGSGELSSIVDLRDNQLEGYRTQLDQLAKGIADAVNAIHVTGVDENGNAGLPVFTYAAGREASTLAVNALISADPRRIAAAFGASSPGDGSVAGRIADLRDATSVPLGTAGSNLVVGANLTTNGTAAVSGVTAPRAKAQGYMLTGTGASLTLTGADGSTETVNVTDIAGNGTGTIAFDKLGIRIELRAGAAGKLATDIVTDLTTAPNSSIQIGSIFSVAQTAADFYAGFIGNLGSDSRQASEMATNQGLVVTHLEQRRESTSGVSLDEEATDMLRFQHAYQAAARVITTMDEMLDTLINRVGIFGR